MDYISKHKKVWEELRELTARAQKGVKRLDGEELSRLDVLYRMTAIHLAQIGTRTHDRVLVQYLSDLTAAAHGIIYQPRNKLRPNRWWEYVHTGFARALARTWRYHAAAAGLTLFGVWLAYWAAQTDPVASYALLPAGEVRQSGSTQEQLISVLRHGRDTGSGGKFLFASFLFSNNFRVALLALATGILAALPTAVLLVYNGMMLGALSAVYHQHGIYAEYWAWILPHGITELSAIFFCGGVGLMLGHAVVAPGLRGRGLALRQAGAEGLCVCGGVGLMLVAAAVIESYLRQSELPVWARLAFAAASTVFWIAYIVHGFLAERRAARACSTPEASFKRS